MENLKIAELIGRAPWRFCLHSDAAGPPNAFLRPAD